MDFDEQADHHHQEHEISPSPMASLPPPSCEFSNLKMSSSTVAPLTSPQPNWKPKYRECLKNHALSIGGHAVDGCGEFMPAGPDGSLDALKCAACNCHRNFHRKETDNSGAMVPFLQPHHHVYYRPGAASAPSGYLHVAQPQQQRPPLALPSSSRDDDNQEGVSAVGKKRFRTKFTQEQKEKMFELAERLGWKIQKHDEEVVQNFCEEVGVRRHVLKVWMHNNKHTLGKKEP